LEINYSYHFRKMIGSISVAFFLIFLSRVLGEVTVLKAAQYIYDKSPKLRIRGSGFDANDHDILLDLGSAGQAPLVMDKDYMITKDSDGDGLILKLLGNRRWVDLSERTPPVAMILSGVRFSSDPKTNLLPDPVIVAQVLNTPSVKESVDILYKSASNELRINGTGFIGSKEVDFYFKPPLTKEVAYEDVTPYPLRNDQIVLRLRHGYNWREDSGPLYVIGVDTGGGPVKLNGDEGVQVADVQENHDLHSVTVDNTAQSQLVYADEANLIINGDGFNPIGNTLRFSNGILGQNINYTTVSTSENSISLRLVSGSFWRKNFENLPGPLTLLAVNAGQGFVAVGPTNSGKGRDVATVFERPEVHSSNKKVYRTHSHELHISGTGFPVPPSLYKPSLKFSPPLKEGVDYTLKVLERDDLEVTLLDGRAWSQEPGSLMVTHINTRGDEAGWVKLPGDGVHVAEVVEDVDSDKTGGIEIIPMGVKVYQSALHQSIMITGTGFKDGMSFVFDPAVREGVDYDLVIQSKNKAVMNLKSGKKWRADAGFIVAKSVKVDGKSYNFAGSEGIRVAVVLADPVITSSTDSYHESQSKLVVISGSGFTNAADTKISLRPTSNSAFKLLGVLEDAIRLQLKPDQAWLPSFSSLNGADDNKKIALQVTSIDTGAGEIEYEEPITVGYVVKDREGVVCDDSCEFAFDGVCDDGSEPNDEYYYQNYNYMDDDLGGFYGEPEDVDGDGVAYGVAYDDYYMPNEDYQVSPCVEGTDCTDCGGVDAVIDYSKPLENTNTDYVTCTNTCIYPRDGVCDDPRGTKYCELGTDCQDCGPVGADNFTRADDDGWWDDDDDYWSFNDGNFIDQAKGLEYNRHKVKVYNRQETAGPAAMFLVVLEGMVYTVGAIFAAAALYLLNRWYKGQSVPFMNVFNPDVNQNSRDFEMRPHQKMPITPDEFRT
jgi:hypothetical protein